MKLRLERPFHRMQGCVSSLPACVTVVRFLQGKKSMSFVEQIMTERKLLDTGPAQSPRDSVTMLVPDSEEELIGEMGQKTMDWQRNGLDLTTWRTSADRTLVRDNFAEACLCSRNCQFGFV